MVEPYFIVPSLPGLNDPSHENPEKHMIGLSLPVAEQVSTIGLTSTVGTSPIPAREDHAHTLGSNFGLFQKGSTFPVTVPTDGDIFYRTDLGRFYIYSGGFWFRLMAGTGTGNMRSEYARLAAQNVNNTTLTDISWDTEVTDTEGAYAVPITNFSVPTDKIANTTTLQGNWNIGGYITWSAAPGSIAVVQWVNNTTGDILTFDHPNTVAVNSTGFSVPSTRWTGAQTWKIRVYQNSGAARTVTGKVWFQWIAP